MTDFKVISDRIAYYRKLAEMTFHRATETPDQETKNGLLRLAAGWHHLASELEKQRDDAADEGPAPRPEPPELPAEN